MQTTPPQRNGLKFLALSLVGAGLVIFGLFAWVMLPRQAAANSGTRERISAVPVQVNFPAPDLKMTNLEGQAVALSDYRGQVVLVNNWATWCPPCKEEMPTFQAFHEAYQDQQFTVLGIEAGEPLAEVTAFIQEHRLTFPIWPDEDERALEAFHNDNLPSSYVVDRTGRVRLSWIGAINREMLEKYVTPIIKE